MSQINTDAQSDVGKHRRNLLVSTCVLIFLRYADASVSVITVGGGAGLKLGNPNALLHFAWLIWAYELIVFTQLSAQYLRPEYERARSIVVLHLVSARLLSLSTKLVDKVNDDYLASLHADYRFYFFKPPKKSVRAPRDMRRAIRKIIRARTASQKAKASPGQAVRSLVASRLASAINSYAKARRSPRINLIRPRQKRRKFLRSLRPSFGWNLTAKRTVGIEEASDSEAMNYNFRYGEGTRLALQLEWRLFVRRPFFVQQLFPRYFAMAAPIYYLAGKIQDWPL